VPDGVRDARRARHGERDQQGTDEQGHSGTDQEPLEIPRSAGAVTPAVSSAGTGRLPSAFITTTAEVPGAAVQVS
jgi:hypothetical protein